MKGSVKANLIVIMIIAIIAFCASSAFASLTIHEETDSYKLMSLEDDSFEPEYIDYVPTVQPKNTTNTTNVTNTTETTVNTTTEDWNETIYNIWETTYDEG